LILFESISNSRWFLKTSIILFLNKIDLFRVKLQTAPLNKYFPDYYGGNDYNSAVHFLSEQFLRLNQSSSKEICELEPGLLLFPSSLSSPLTPLSPNTFLSFLSDVHQTSAVDTTSMKFVLSAVNVSPQLLPTFQTFLSRSRR